MLPSRRPALAAPCRGRNSGSRPRSPKRLASLSRFSLKKMCTPGAMPRYYARKDCGMFRVLRLVVVSSLLTFSACPSPWTIGDNPEPPKPPQVFAPGASTLAPPPSVPPPAPVQPEPDPTPVVTYIRQAPTPAPEPPREPTPLKGRGKSLKGPSEPPPQQLILEAQQKARVAPSREGYFGSKGVQRYLWNPGKIYDVYLSPGSGTKLTLPPGEVLAHALIL